MHEIYENFIKNNPNYSGIEHRCNICGYRFSRFLNFNKLKPREGRCPVCDSLERHRHLAIHLFSIYPFLKGKKILHFAPEKIIKNILLDSEGEYFDADIDEKKARYKVDITNIFFQDDMFDYIICIHVLEHILDDIKALSELYRVLKPNGIAFLSVPYRNELFEDYSITLPKEREKFYGKSDHVRNYDFKTFLSRIKNAGFNIKVSYSSKQSDFFKDCKLGDDIVLAKKIIF